ncbi:MAG: type I glyceraldehyde-3-phosphate dehydrogenase [Candidatus Pacebacteria bacterium]|nr:type I glyceraldehyde-3-phosphate dehydrogenase [Candidatus Paceibacterota bacterium]
MTDKKTRVAINGFGRIGRAFLKLAYAQHSNIEIVAINDLGDIENLAYLLKYDTAQGMTDLIIDINADKTHMHVNGDDIRVLQQRAPQDLPWAELDIDVVVECTGFFTKYDMAALHLDAGAKHVLISAPGKGEPRAGVESETVIMGVNTERAATCQITSNGSCTTNASAPLMSILSESIGVEKALLNTTHGYTATQSTVDSPARGSDFRKGRAAAQNIVPTSTGAAIAVTKALPELVGKFDGIACRVPVVTGSIADVTFVASRDTSVEEINQILSDAAQSERWKGIFTVTNEPVVSSDIIGRTEGSIADLGMTRVVDGNLVKVMAWYDNEMGYTNTLIRHSIQVGKNLHS